MEKELTIGVILKPQGIRGEIKVQPFTDRAEDFCNIKRILIDGAERRVLSVRIGAGAVFLGLMGVPDRNAAELLRGKEIKILREDAPDLGEGSYYIADLLGAKAYFEDGELVGTLTNIRQAATDIYSLETPKGEIMFPAVKGVIKEIDPEAGKLILDKKRFSEVAVL